MKIRRFAPGFRLAAGLLSYAVVGTVHDSRQAEIDRAATTTAPVLRTPSRRTGGPRTENHFPAAIRP